MHENIRSFANNYDEFHSLASELGHAGTADVIVLSEMCYSADTCHYVEGYTGFHTKQEAVSLCLLEIASHRPIWLIFQCVMHIMRSVCHAYYEISVVKISLSNKCTVIIRGVYRPPDKSKILKFGTKLN